MIKKILFTLFLLFISINCFSNNENLEGIWNLTSSINKNGDEILSKDNNDKLTIQSNTFSYTLNSGEIIENGTFKKNKENLLFNYTTLKSDSIENKAVVTLDNNNIKIVDNNKIYLFSKQHKLIPVSESGSIFTNILRGLLGILFIVFLSWIVSVNKKAIDWKLVVKGILLQIVIAFLVLEVSFIAPIFEAISQFFVVVIKFTNAGVDFLFSSWIDGKLDNSLVNFAIKVLPTIIFFSALSSLLYYMGVLQKIVFVLAWLMKKSLGLSGAESLSAAGNIFLGQTESPFLVKPFIAGMTKSEIMCLMTGGMATLAGGVLAAYVGFLGGTDEVQQLFFAKHLLAASVMSAPAAIVASKIIVPETKEVNTDLKIAKEKIGTNALEAISNGTTDGIKLAVNVGAMLLVFTALIAMGNYLLGDIIGAKTGLNTFIAANTQYSMFSFQFIVGYLASPIAWLVGVPTEDIVLVGQLLGEKTILNEFYAYKTLGEMKASGMFTHEKSIIIATYILCGFSNVASIGIQIGGISVLAPNQKGTLSKLGVLALIAGTFACLFTASIVGMII